MRRRILLVLLGILFVIPVYAQESGKGFSESYFCGSEPLRWLFNLTCEGLDSLEPVNEESPRSIQFRFFTPPPTSTPTPSPIIGGRGGLDGLETEVLEHAVTSQVDWVYEGQARCWSAWADASCSLIPHESGGSEELRDLDGDGTHDILCSRGTGTAQETTIMNTSSKSFQLACEQYACDSCMTGDGSVAQCDATIDSSAKRVSETFTITPGCTATCSYEGAYGTCLSTTEPPTSTPTVPVTSAPTRIPTNTPRPTSSPTATATPVRPSPTSVVSPTPAPSGNVVFAAVYGRPNGWGSLSAATTPEKAISMTKAYAQKVSGIRGGKPTVGLVNLNISSYPATSRSCNISYMSSSYITRLIQLAKQNNMYVMLDVQTGYCNPLTAMKDAIDTFLIEDNVFFDIDIEWIRYNGSTSISGQTIHDITQYYVTKRSQKGYTNKGYLGFYIFQMQHITSPSLVSGNQRGNMISLFDGYGSCTSKGAVTDRMVSLFGKPYAGMEFETKWGRRYDSCSASAYFSQYPDFKAFLSQ